MKRRNKWNRKVKFGETTSACAPSLERKSRESRGLHLPIAHQSLFKGDAEDLKHIKNLQSSFNIHHLCSVLLRSTRLGPRTDIRPPVRSMEKKSMNCAGHR